jgi:glyoxylase-like metal-dependent hydrolase (beta-lactamase superfamily II)
MLTLHLFDTGHCVVHEHVVLGNRSRRPMDCHALVALLGHPRFGWSLWDTGYALRMLTETQVWPFRLYRSATPLRLRPGMAAVDRLAAYGLQVSDIRRVFVSHFHADHIAGLRDFPHAEIIATEAALASIQRRQGFSALRRGLIPALLPSDLAERVRPLPAFSAAPLPHLGPTCDFFGDGSVRLVDLPGHACGQMGALVETITGAVLLAADGAWTRRSIREQLLPSRITYLFIDSPQAVRTTLRSLHEFARVRPEVRIVPTHCPEAFSECVSP